MDSIWVKILTHVGAFAAGAGAGWVLNDMSRAAETQATPKPTTKTGQ